MKNITNTKFAFVSLKRRTQLKHKWLKFISYFFVFLVLVLVAQHILWTYTNSQNDTFDTINDNEIRAFIDLYRKPLIFGPMKWSDLTQQTKDTFYEFYDTHCPLTRNISRSKLIVEGNFNDNRIPPTSNVPEWFIPFIDYKTKNKLYWDIEGILYGIKNYEKHSNTPTGCGHSGYPNSCRQFVDLFEKYPNFVKDKNVLVMGSITPWIEIILMYHGANVTTTDYNIPILHNPSEIIYNENNLKLKIVSITDLFVSDFKFDIIVSYSCLEHDGLGRYGDPLNPNGDFASMYEFYYLLKNDKTRISYLLLSIPLTHRDYIMWNSHRFYGKCRFDNLIKNKFQVQEAFGSYDNERFITKEEIKNGSAFIPNQGNHQPLIIMKKII